MPPRRRLPLRGARHQPLGRGDLPPPPAQPLLPAPSPQVQDQLLGLRHRLRPGHVQRRRRHRGDATTRGRHGRARVPGLLRRGAGCEPPRGPGPGGVHPQGAAPPHHRSGPAHLRPLRQPRQQAQGPHEVAPGHNGRGRAARAHPQRAQAPARCHHLGRGHPRDRPARGRRARGGFDGRRPHPGRCARNPQALRDQPLRPLGDGQRDPGRGQGDRVRLRPRPSGGRDRGPVPRPGRDPARAGVGAAGDQPPERGLPRARRRSAVDPVPAPGRHRHGPARGRAGARRRRLPGRRYLQPGRHPEPGPG